MPLDCPDGHGPFADWAGRCPDRRAYHVGRETIVRVATAPNEPVALMWLDPLKRADIPAVADALGPGVGRLGTRAMLPHGLSVTAPDLARAGRVIAGPSPARPRRAAIVADPRRKR